MFPRYSFPKIAFAVLAAISSPGAFPYNLEVESSKPVYVDVPDKKTGLDKVLVAWFEGDRTTIRIVGAPASLKVQKYSNLGGGYAQDVSLVCEGADRVIPYAEAETGYIISDGIVTEYIWLVNYRNHILRLDGVAPAEVQDCSGTHLYLEGSGDLIRYYTIDGRPMDLDRDIKLTYNNLSWNGDQEAFVQASVTKTLAYLQHEVNLVPPLLCSSSVKVSGDRFLDYWGIGESCISAVITPNGIEVHTNAEQDYEDSFDTDMPSNILNTDSQDLGGSAPALISFRAITTDAVRHNEWQIASDMEFEYIDYRFTEQDLDYTFDSEGIFYVRFVGSNEDGSCEAFGDTYTINIGASDLRIPNAFTPNEDGVNDVWKVAYRSLLEFKCSIFDRYGNKITSFTDPSQGWDGKYNGKMAKPGVYFYVIEATGADGKRYKKGGDINLIRSKRFQITSE